MRSILIVTGFITVISTFSVSNTAHAGFEWLPPSHMTATPAPVKPAPTASHTMAPMPALLEPVSEMAPMAAVPAPVVTMEKLETTTMPADVEPSSGLMIDPYPLKAKKLVSMTVQRSTVEQALVEETDVLNPLPLGGEMNTGIIAPGARLAMNAIEEDPMMDNPMGMTPMPVDVQPLPGTFPHAIGFAKDVPLALALSQVIPDDFSHSYMRGVDAGKIVSWDGGKPWNEVLQEMLNEQGLAFQIQDKKVVVHQVGQL